MSFKIGAKVVFRDDIREDELEAAGLNEPCGDYPTNMVIIPGEVTITKFCVAEYDLSEDPIEWYSIKESFFQYPVSFFK